MTNKFTNKLSNILLHITNIIIVFLASLLQAYYPPCPSPDALTGPLYIHSTQLVMRSQKG